MEISSKRAKHIAIIALVLSVIFFLATWIIGFSSGAFAVAALSWQILAGGLIWFVLAIWFHQRNLADQEKLDMAQLAKAREAGTIFQAESEQSEAFAVAAKRLEVMEKWFVPASAVLVALYQIVVGVFLVRRAAGDLDIGLDRIFTGMVDWESGAVNNPLLFAIFMVTIAFVSFLISRYATGLSAQEKWKPLRAGSSYLLATAILAFLAAVALVLAQYKYYFGLQVLAWVIPILLMLLGVEIILNAILDIYRPRVPGHYSRPAFDSRLLGMINEPGGIFHTVASTLDYQFGFQVSQTWFYRLLEKAVLPLLLFAALVLYLLSCFLVVGPGEQAIVERFGDPVERGGQYALGPGLHLKLPWPVDIAYKHPTEQVQQINVGFVEKEEDSGQKALLWGEKHYEEEFHILVATREAETITDIKGAPPVSVVLAAVPVHYRVKDLHSYLYKHADAKALLEAICYRELMRFAASANIETDVAGEEFGEASILGRGRKAAADQLKAVIQDKADEAGLGVEIVLLNLQGIHPPPEVTAEYQAVIAAVQKKQAAILEAEAERNQILASLAGSTAQADGLYDLAYEYQQVKNAGTPEEVEQVRQRFLAAISQARGEIFKTIRQADAYAYEQATLAEATGNRFQDQLLAYKTSPAIYMHLQRLQMLEEALQGSRKYVVVADKDDQQVYIVDLEESLSSNLYDMELLQQEQ